jgi:hypothetical protein
MTIPGGPRPRPANAGDLVEAARRLGCEAMPNAAEVSSSEGPIGLLALSAVVLAAAECQVVNAEREVLENGGTVADLAGAADVSALVATTGKARGRHLWLIWHTDRLIHQLEMAEQRGDLPPRVGITAARCVSAARQLLAESIYGTDDRPDHVAAGAVSRVRRELLAVLDDIDALDPSGRRATP